MQVGYVGLGVMGGALARRLQLGRNLVVYDLNPAAVADLVGRGAEAAESLAELAARCEVVLLCLPTSAHVREAIFGAGGLLEGAKAGTLIVDQTTGDPTATRAMAAELEPRGITLIDAPVSGGAKGADAGTIAIMVGAGPEAFARIAPVFADISPNVFHAGGIGAGQVVKIVNNLISQTQRLLTQEGLALAARNGVDPGRTLEILRAGGGRNAYMEKTLPRVLQGNLKVGFTLGLAGKDVKLACDLGAATGVPTPFGALASGLYAKMVADYGYDAEVETSALDTQKNAGTTFVPDTRDQ